MATLEITAGPQREASPPDRHPAPAEAPSAGSAYGTWVKPRVDELLRAVGLDVTFVRGAGDHLYHRDGAGHERAVLDMLGGYGVSLFGHNHPRLVEAFRDALDQQLPFAAQASVRHRAGLLGQRLSEWVGASTGGSYVCTFTSSGAEAVEAALKHAEHEAWTRRSELVERWRLARADVEEAVRAGAPLAPAAEAEAERVWGAAVARDPGAVLEAIEAELGEALSRPPVLLALNRSFHGKTTGALRLTHNPEYRRPWERLAPAVFLPESPEALDEAVARARTAYHLARLDAAGRIELTTHHLTDVVAAFLEPIQGEGGIREVSAAYAKALREAATREGFPLVIDEIQSGMGRTGTFLASEPLGVRGDYYLLSKALGGALTKIGVLLVDRERYLPDFGYLHTSTFAEDELSSAVALAALDLLAADGGRLMHACREKGDFLKARLRAAAARFPGQLGEVRGRGLMIGFELLPQPGSPSRILRVMSEQGLLAMVVAGYLFREHAIRVAPTLSAHGTIRLEPSAEVSYADLDRAVDAIEDAAALLRDGDVATLVRHLLDPSVLLDRAAPAAAPSTVTAATATCPPPDSRVAFLVHYREPSDLKVFDDRLAAFGDDACATFTDRTRGLLDPFVLDRATITSGAPRGARTEVTIIAVPFTAQQAAGAIRRGEAGWITELVRKGVVLAREEGCGLVGLGGYTSIVTDNCRLVRHEGIGVTSGNSLTAAAGLEAAFEVARQRGIARPRVGIVGALGNIGALLAELAAAAYPARELVLVGRAGAASRLEALRGRIGASCRVSTAMESLRDCDLVITATNSAQPIIQPEHLGDHPTVICDVAVPRDTARSVPSARPACTVIRGGVVRLPLGQRIALPGVTDEAGGVYACMAETLLLGLAGRTGHFSCGALARERVLAIKALAQEHGFGIERRIDVQ